MDATNRELVEFIDHARQKGMDHNTIRMLLLAAGWKEKDVLQALMMQGLDRPIPAPPDAGGAREAFYHLLYFAAFFTTVTTVMILLFALIDLLFPDPALEALARRDMMLSGIRWSLAFLIVAFPTFLFLSRVLARELRARPDQALSSVHRGLTYLTLFAAAITIAIDLVVLVYNLLAGELSARFLFKITVVLAVAALSFSYYLLSLRTPPADPRAVRRDRSFGAAALVVVLIAAIGGFVVAGSPGGERERRIDEERVRDLKAIRGEIVNICRRTPQVVGTPPELVRPLPASLEELVRDARRVRPRIRDPRTGEPYAYDVLGESRYRLCATFTTVRDFDDDVQWNHPVGRHCYELDALSGQ